SPYEKGRSRQWLKLKAQANQELAVIGWTPGKGNTSGSLGALLLGVADGKGGYEFAGKVGTGFSSQQRAELKKLLAKHARGPRPARAARGMGGAGWVDPGRVAQVHFPGWTSDGKLRHPAFRGLGADKRPEGAVRGGPAEASETSRPKEREPRAPKRSSASDAG